MNTFLLAVSAKPDGSFAFTATVVVAGIATVLATLAVLVVLFSLFGRLVRSSEEKAKKKVKKPEEPVPAPPVIKYIAPLLIEEEEPSGEVVAAISAAVCAYEGKDVKITSVRRAKKRSGSAWAQAAINENTKPF